MSKLTQEELAVAQRVATTKEWTQLFQMNYFILQDILGLKSTLFIATAAGSLTGFVLDEMEAPLDTPLEEYKAVLRKRIAELEQIVSASSTFRDDNAAALESLNTRLNQVFELEADILAEFLDLIQASLPSAPQKDMLDSFKKGFLA